MKKFKFLKYFIPFIVAAGLVWGAATDYKVDNLGRIFGYDLIVKGPWVDVRAFGAKGDGVTNDTVAIKAAIAATPSGGTLYFPPTTSFYLVDPFMDLVKPITLRGTWGSKIKVGDANIYWETESTPDHYKGIFNIRSSNVMLDSMYIDGNGTNNPISLGTEEPGPGEHNTPIHTITIGEIPSISPSGISNITIKNCILPDPIWSTIAFVYWHADATYRHKNILITGNYFRGGRRDMLPITQANHVTVSNNYFNDNLHDSIHVYQRASHINIIGNNIYISNGLPHTLKAIAVGHGGYPDTVDHVNVIGNIVVIDDDTQGECIAAPSNYGTRYVTVANNNFTGGLTCAHFGTASKSLNVHHNIFRKGGLTAGQVVLISNSFNMQFTHNIISDTASTEVISGSVTQANMKISAEDGTAFVDFSAASILTDNIGKYVLITDSAGKTISGYIKAAGTGETLGNELVVNGTFDTDTTGWSAYLGAVLSVDTARLKVLNGAADYGHARQTTPVTQGALLKMSCDGTAGTVGYRIDVGITHSFGDGIYYSAYTDMVNIYRTTVSTNLCWSLWVNSGTIDQYVYFDDVTAKQVLTPSATGVTIVSTQDGTIYNWSVKDSGFNYNDSSGYTYKIAPMNLSKAIFITGYYGLSTSYNKITNNVITSTGLFSDAIRIGSDVTYNEIGNNDLSGVTVTGKKIGGYNSTNYNYIHDNMGWRTEYETEISVAIDSTGLKTATIETGIENIDQYNRSRGLSFEIINVTTGGTFGYDFIGITSFPSTTSFVLGVNVTRAHPTGGATAKIAVRVIPSNTMTAP